MNRLLSFLLVVPPLAIACTASEEPTADTNQALSSLVDLWDTPACVGNPTWSVSFVQECEAPGHPNFRVYSYRVLGGGCNTIFAGDAAGTCSAIFASLSGGGSSSGGTPPPPPPPPPPSRPESPDPNCFLDCLDAAPSNQLHAYVQCLDATQCPGGACDDRCWQQSGCAASSARCTTYLDRCSAQCPR